MSAQTVDAHGEPSSKKPKMSPSCYDADLDALNERDKMEPISLQGPEIKDQMGNSVFERTQRCITCLVHACECRNAACHRMSCHKMKWAIQHAKMCEKRVNSSCPVCKQLIALCCYHARRCNRDDCKVLFCVTIRQKLTEKKRSMARRSDMMLRRRVEGLHACVAPPSSTNTTANALTPAPSAPNVATPQSSQAMSHGSMSAGPSSVGSAKENPPTPQPGSAQHNMKGGNSM